MNTNDAIPLSTVFSVLSIIGCIFNTATTIMFKISKTAMGKMVIALSIMDFIFSLSYLIILFQISHSFICQILSFFWTFGFLGSLWWSCSFAHCLYRSIKRVDDHTADSFLRQYWVISITLGLVFAVLAICMEFWTLKIESHTCIHHVSTDPNFDWSGVIIFLIPALLSSAFCCISYIAVVKELYHYRSELFIELLIYPLILIICDFPIAIRALYFTITGERIASSWLYYICPILLRSQGFFNALAFGLSKRIVHQYKRMCRQNRYNQDKLEDSLLYSQKQGLETTSLPKFVVS